MSDLKHTPGPWDNDNNVIWGGKNDNIIAVSASFKYKEGEANAKLIAAAPDLLKELRNMVESWDDDCFIDVEIDKARAAIKKATE